MSISSDVYITKEEAKVMLKQELMSEQEKLVDAAIKGMKDWEITSRLHTETYFYHITKTKTKKE